MKGTSQRIRTRLGTAWALACLLGATVSPLHAATYYVRTDGDDSCDGRADAAGPGPGACAFATPQACADALQCGDDCLVRAGTYIACPTHPAIGDGDWEIMFALDDLTCSEATRTTLKGFGDGEVIFQAAGGCDYALMTSNVTHFTVGGTGSHEGLTFRGDFDHDRGAGEDPGDPTRRGTITFLGGYAGENRFNELIGNRLGGTAFDVGADPEVIFLQTNTGFAFEGHRIAYNSLVANRNGDFSTLSVASSPQCKGPGACDTVNPNPTTIHHNVISNAAGDANGERIALGIIGCSDCEVHHNYIVAGSPGATTIRQSFYNRDNRRERIYDNHFVTYSDESSLTSCIYFQDTDDNVFEEQRLYNNTCYGVMRVGFRLDSTDATEFRNNLFVGVSASQPIEFPFRTGGSNPGSLVDHNAFFHAGTFSCPNDASCAGGDVASDPRIQATGDMPVPFLQLQATSPVIDAGSTDSDAPSTDYDGESRDASPDIGADELGCAEGDGDGDGVSACLDCDDADPTTYPGAEEICDGRDNDCDGIPDAGQDTDNDLVDDLCDAYPADPARSGPLYVGLTEPFDHIWSRIELPHVYQNPVVIVGPPSSNGFDPGVVQIVVDQASGDAFDIRFREWLYLDGAHHLSETVAYAVMERGRYVMQDGSIWEWNTFLQQPGQPTLKTQSFIAPFPSPPALFLTTQLAKNQPNALRAANVTATTFEAGMFEEEALTGTLEGGREVGYLAIHSADGSGRVAADGTELPYLLQRRAINPRFAPVLSWTLALQEESSQDAETSHMDTTVAALALGRHLFAQDVTTSGLDTVSLRRIDPDPALALEWGLVDGLDETWRTIPLFRSYADPVVIVEPVSADQATPGVIRLRGVSPDSFQAQWKGWKYLPCCSGPERAFYMVGESGTHDVAGLTVDAGTSAVSGTLGSTGWTALGFGTAFTGTPAVFASVQTNNGWDPIVARVSGSDASGFQAAIQEEEGGDTAHIDETLGWIAIQPGLGATASGREIEVFTTLVDSNPTPVGFTFPTQRRFRTVVADVASTYDVDACTLRHASVSQALIELFVQEEQSADAETQHGAETVSIFAAE